MWASAGELSTTFYLKENLGVAAYGGGELFKFFLFIKTNISDLVG